MHLVAAAGTLHVKPGSQLAQIVGSGTVTFDAKCFFVVPNVVQEVIAEK